MVRKLAYDIRPIFSIFQAILKNFDFFIFDKILFWVPYLFLFFVGGRGLTNWKIVFTNFLSISGNFENWFFHSMNELI